MVVKTKTAPMEQPVASAPPMQRLLIQKIHTVMMDHPELSAAKQKLRSIEEKRAVLQAEFDQAQAAVQNPDLSEMAATVLDGGDLSDVDTVVQQRDSLRQKIQAHDLAIQQQRAVIMKARNAASVDACNVAAPIHRNGVERLLNAFSEIQASVEELAMIQNSLGQNEVATDNRFAYFGLTELQQLCRRLDHMRTSDWQPWLAKMGE